MIDRPQGQFPTESVPTPKVSPSNHSAGCKLPIFMVRYLFNRMCIPQQMVLGTDRLTS